MRLLGEVKSCVNSFSKHKKSFEKFIDINTIVIEYGFYSKNTELFGLVRIVNLQLEL
jgi:hypothetical protein